MSEYQYYEWLTIDRPLTSKEQRAVNELSSHIEVTSIGASVDYSWGNFKHDPLEVLAEYFDAFLYYANWGDNQLAFRLPANLVDADTLQDYVVDSYIMLQRSGDHLVLHFALSGEDPPDEWIEPDDWLAMLAPLRNDLLNGDHRVLYLAWLRAAQLTEGDEDEEEEVNLVEPPVPPGLEHLTPALQAFVNWFELDDELLEAAAKASSVVAKTDRIDFESAIRKLSREECNDFLLRLVNNEAHLGPLLRRRLRDV